MEITREEMGRTGLMVLCGVLISMLVGLCFFGTRIFVYTMPTFQFVLFGLVLSLLVSVARQFNARVFLCCAALVIVLLPFSTNAVQKLHTDFIIRDLVLGISFAASIFAANNLVRSKAMVPNIFLEMGLWTLFIILAFVVSVIVLALLFRPEDAMVQLQYQVRLAVLIGASVSLGTIGCHHVLTKVKM